MKIKTRYFVFVSADYVRNAQAFLNSAALEEADEENEGGWQDVSGPVLLMEKTVSSRKELLQAIQDVYPNVDFDVLEIVDVETFVQH